MPPLALTAEAKVRLERSLLKLRFEGDGPLTFSSREVGRSIASHTLANIHHVMLIEDRQMLLELTDANLVGLATRLRDGLELKVRPAGAEEYTVKATVRPTTVQDVDLFLMKLKARENVYSLKDPGNPQGWDEFAHELNLVAQEESEAIVHMVGAGDVLNRLFANPSVQPDSFPTVAGMSDEEMRRAISGMQDLLRQRAQVPPTTPPSGGGGAAGYSPHPGSTPGTGAGQSPSSYHSLPGQQTPVLGYAKPHKFRTFSGPNKLRPDHASWESWEREVLQAEAAYPADVVKEMLERSLVGDPLEISQGFPIDLPVREIVARLKGFFGPVQELDQVRSTFHQIKMEHKESVSSLVTRLEKWSRRVNAAAGQEEVTEHTLKSRLFHALRAELQQQVRHLYDNNTVTYRRLITYLRKVESNMEPPTSAEPPRRKPTPAAHTRAQMAEPAEEVEDSGYGASEEGAAVSTGSTTSGAHAATEHNSNAAVMEALMMMTKTFKELQFSDDGRRRARRGGRGGRGRGSSQPSTTTPANAKVQAKDLICHRCGGAGHLARDCPSRPENASGNASGDQVMGANQTPAPEVGGTTGQRQYPPNQQ